jgi:hypothetical protein
VLFVAIRQGMRGQVRVLGAVVVLVTIVTMTLAFSPLSTLISERLDNGHSNDIRQSLAQDAIVAATNSPIIGFGSTRATIGADATIAVGRSPDCPKCGNADIGSTGQLWLVLIAQGVVGAGLYLGFFLQTMWRHRRDASAIGVAGMLVVGLQTFYSLFYSALIVPLAVALLSVALVWRNEQGRFAKAADPTAADS